MVDDKVAPGTYLLSMPQLRDPNFMHTVVLMIEHSEQGAYGLVVNRHLELSLRELLSEHPLLSQCDQPVYCGGPVGTDTLQFLHRCPEDVPGGLEVVQGLYLGGDVEAMARAVAAGGVEAGRLRLFVGYSGWGQGQLEGELTLGSWLLAPPDPDLCFADEGEETTWRRALRSLGREGEGLSHLPPDASWN